MPLNIRFRPKKIWGRRVSGQVLRRGSMRLRGGRGSSRPAGRALDSRVTATNGSLEDIKSHENDKDLPL
jgi:hypothetical protein